MNSALESRQAWRIAGGGRQKPRIISSPQSWKQVFFSGCSSYLKVYGGGVQKDQIWSWSSLHSLGKRWNSLRDSPEGSGVVVEIFDVSFVVVGDA